MSSDESGSSVPSNPPEKKDEEPTAPGEGSSEAASTSTSPTPGRKRQISRLLFLVFGLLVAVYLGKLKPQEQHVRVVLGAAAPEVVGVELQYIAEDGEIARQARFTYPAGAAPRIVAHEPELPNGDYRLQIEVDTRDGRRGTQRQVTLGGGSTQVDVSSALTREQPPPSDEGHR